MKAVLRVPEGDSVTASGSSKKIAKNIAGDQVTSQGDCNLYLAAKMMLDLLERKKENINNETVSSLPLQAGAGGDSNNNSSTERSVPTLSKDSARSVGEFYRKLHESHGEILDKLTGGQICLAEDITTANYARVLDDLAQVCIIVVPSYQPHSPQEQQFGVKFLQLESVDGVEQSLVQLLSEGLQPAVTVCLGVGPASKNAAARCALMYIKTMAA